MNYARAIRLSLAASRTRGLDFPSAWAIALEAHPVAEADEALGFVGKSQGTWASTLPFLKKTMRNAYERKPLSRGQKPTLIVPLSERTEAVTGRYSRSERGRTSLEPSAAHIA